MDVFRVPCPRDPRIRDHLLERARRYIAPFGAVEGTTESGAFEGHTPVGTFAGRYFSLDDSDELEIELIRRPWLVPLGLVKTEARRFIAKNSQDIVLPETPDHPARGETR